MTTTKRYKDLAKIRKNIKDSIKFSDKNLIRLTYKNEAAINRYAAKECELF